jgi:hypothetical protein
VEPPNKETDVSRSFVSDTSFERRYSLLIKEWELCEGSIGRYDTIVFAIRGWAVSIFTAVLAASAAANEPKLILFSLVPPLLFWAMDALNKSFQLFSS